MFKVTSAKNGEKSTGTSGINLCCNFLNGDRIGSVISLTKYNNLLGLDIKTNAKITSAKITNSIKLNNKLTEVLISAILIPSSLLRLIYFDQLKIPLLVNSDFNSFVTSTFEGERIYIPLSTS